MELYRLDTDDIGQPLEELEPSPIDETPSPFPPTKKRDGYFAAPPPRRSLTASLGLSSDRIPHYLHQTQKYSSLLFLAFAGAHIVNTSIIPLWTRSVDEAGRYLLLTRPYYQTRVLEVLLVAGPLALHVAAGAALRAHRARVLTARRRPTDGASKAGATRSSAWPRMSGTSALGYLAVPLVLGHASLNRLLPLWVDGGSSAIGLDFVGHAVARHSVWLGCAGFAALVGVVSLHVVWGTARWAGVTPEAAAAAHGSAAAGATEMQKSGRRRRRRWALNAAAAGLAALWAAGGIGVVARAGTVQGWVGKNYDDLLRSAPIIGPYL